MIKKKRKKVLPVKLVGLIFSTGLLISLIYFTYNAPNTIKNPSTLIEQSTEVLNIPEDKTGWKQIQYYDVAFDIPTSWTTKETGRDEGPYALVIQDEYEGYYGNLVIEIVCDNVTSSKECKNSSPKIPSKTIKTENSTIYVYDNSTTYELYIEATGDLYRLSHSNPMKEKNYINYAKAIAATIR